MEMKVSAKHKTLWKKNSTSEPLSVTGVEDDPLKKFTIPKIRRKVGKVYLSPCLTNTREYSFIHDTLNQCRLDGKCDLQSSWQFGDTKLVHNEQLEKNFTSKRSEMRENGRHGRETEEHFCFLALPQGDVAEIYQNGLSTTASTLKILGNPLFGIYLFRHVDVALNYAHSRSINVESVLIFKVLFGKVKKVHLSVDKNKVSLDPSPNFDCHMSRNAPSLRHTVELQAYNSAVYFYEYNVLSKPVDKPRQCLPYAIITIKFIGQKVDNGHLMTSLRFLSTGFPKSAERTCSLNNCTVAKRIGKGKDAAVIFEHFRKPVDPHVQENCSCNILNSKTDCSTSDISNSYENVQHGNVSVLDTSSGQVKHDLTECRDTSQVQAYDSSLSFIPSDTRESGDGGDHLLSLIQLKNILSGLSTAFPLHNNTGSSTVITSRVIKDPRLTRREESMDKHHNITGLNEILPFEKSLNSVNSEINLPVPTNSATSSEAMPSKDIVLTNCLDAACFKIPSDDSQSQAQNIGSMNCDYKTPNKITTAGQVQGQDNCSFPICLSNVVSEVENRKHSEEQAEKSQQRSNIPLLVEQNNEPCNSYELVNTGMKGCNSHISQELQPSNLKPVCKPGHQASTTASFQRKENIHEYVQNIEKLRNFTSLEENFKHVEKQNLWEGMDNCTNETKISTVDNYQEHKEDESLDSFGRDGDQKLISQESEISGSSSATRNKLKYRALELQNNLTPRVESLSQKHPQDCLEKDNIHTCFSISRKLMELKLEKNQNGFSIITDAFQKAKDIPQAKEVPLSTVTSSHDIKTAHDDSNCSIAREHTCVHRKNENDLVSLENIQTDCEETSQIDDKNEDHILFCNAKLNDDIYLDVYLKQQRTNKDNQNVTKEEDIASPVENNIENTCGDEKQGFHTNKNLLEIEDTTTGVKQKDTQTTTMSVEHLASALPQISGSLLHVTPDVATQRDGTVVPALGTNHDNHQGYEFKETYSSESPYLGLVIKHRVSDCEMERDKNRFHSSFHQSISDKSVLQNFSLDSEIEIESEQCNDTFLFQQDTQSHGNTLYEEFGASYEALKSRIDWEGLFGSNIGEEEVLNSTTRREQSDQHYSDYSSTQENKAEPFNPILLPDLQVRITNTLMPGFNSTVESLAPKDKFCERITEFTKPEICDEKGDVLGFEIYSQCSGENSDYPCEDEVGNIRQESGLESKSETSLSFDLSHNTHMNHIPEGQNSGPLLTEPSNVIEVNNESRCSLTKSKTDYNETRSKKDTESRITKRKSYAPFVDQNIPHHELCEKKRWLTSKDTSECFSSLFRGQIKAFSQSEKHIRRVLDVLNSEIPLCNSKCLSKNLRALLYLKKSHRRDFLEFITKLGETRKSPLPKLFAIICSNFWESCNFQGYSSLSERQHSTKYFFSERKQDKLEKRALGFEGNKSLTHVSKYQSHKTSGDRITKCFSKKNVANNVSRNHITIHMREFGDQERPESQLILCSTSQSSSHSAYNSSHIGSPRPEVQTFSGKTGCLLSPDCPEGKQTEKENQSDVKSLSNNKYEKPENHLAHNNKDALKENAEANEVINKTNSVSLHCIKENNVSLNTDKSHNMTRIASTKMNKPDNLILFGYERNPEVKFLEKWTSTENSKPGPITGNICMDPSNQTLITSKKCSSIPQLLSTAPVTDSGGESSKPYLDKQRIFAVNSFATSTNVPHCQQECGGKELRKSQQCSPSNCVHIDRNSQSGLVPVTEKESKSYGENTTERLFYSDSSPLLKDDIKGSSKRYISKKDIPDRKTWKVNQTERAKDSFHTKSVTAVPAAKNEWTNRKMKILEESSSSEKTIRNNLIESHLSIKNTKEAISLNNTVSNQLNKGEKGGGVQVSPGSQSASTLHSETACNSKPDILGMNPTPALHAHSETSKVITPQSKPTSYVNKLEEEHCSANHAGLTVKLAQILRRADEASSLQSLQEETKVCQSILPFFVEAFERMQECSFEQILISRELLVEKNLWNNWKHKLKPCAVDSLVELQMMMETIQFIENKKRLLGGEQTFRSLLWYDETLYSELLGKPRGFQQQSNFYPGFQGRLKYNAFCEFQDYQDQLIELLENTKRETDSYYAFLKCKRQINECEAILRHYSDCFDFSLSVPFTCGVNFGDSLGDLETLRQSTLKLISMYSDSPKFDSRSGKEDHLWIIVEMIASKVNFMKNNEAVSIHVSLYGLEHIFFDAAKSLVWKERRQSFNKKYSGQKNKETLLKMNQYSFSRLQKIYDTLSKDLSSEQISNIVPEENIGMASRKLNDLINKEPINIENCRFNSTLLSLPDICCINEILAQAEFADCTKLQELTLRCTDHLEILKKYFQMLQEDNIDNIFITEENVLDVVKNHHHEAVILKPEATETYVEIAMLLETVHYLKNSMAKKLDKQRFRSMLWFDLSLLPELVHCQEKMASFSFLEGNSIDCLWEVIETAISELKKDLDIIYKYNEAVNSSYALHLFSRELEELSEIKKLLKDSKYSISTYINFVPCIASINYGSTVTELEYNYCHFSTLLRNIMAAPQKDLGKMAHIVKVMKTIEHMKIICAKNAELTISFILCQMLYNRTKSFELKRKGKIDVLLKPRKPISKSSTCIKVPSISECTMKNVSNSKKRPISADEHEDSQEQEKNTAVSSCKKQKVNMKDVTKINREKATFKHPRTTRFHPESESEIEPSSSDNQKGNHGSPKKAEMQRPLPRSSLPLKNLKDTSMFQSGEKIDVTDISSDTAEDFTGQQENLNSMKKRDKNFSVADKKDCSPFAISDQKSIDGSFSKDHKTPSQKFLNSPDLSGIKPGTDASLQPNASVPSKSIFCFVRDTQANLEMKDTVFELQGNELLNSPIKNSTGPNSPKPVLTQNRVPVLQINETQPEKPESKKQCMKATLSPSSVPVETSENITLNVNQTAEYSFSKQRNNEGSKALTQKAATSRNELPQSACTPVYNTSEQSLGTVYPASGWGVYYYNSSSGDSVTQTYQGIMSTEAQRPSEMLTVVPSTAQNAHSNLLYSQYFGYFAGGPQAYYLMPTNGHFPSQMPVSYVAQQPAFSQYVSYQPLPQAAYPCPPQAGARPQVPWTYVSWQYQEPFQPRH